VSGTATRLAAQRATATEIQRLHDSVARLGSATDAVEHRRIEGRLFIDVAAIAQSVRLTRLEIDLQAELGQLLWGTDLSRADQELATHRHERVVQAIADRRGDAARQLTEEHIASTTSRLIALHVRLTRGTIAAGGESVSSRQPADGDAETASPHDRAAAPEDGR
jgi:DNA-binding FadR family transcriptional regulator